MDSWNGVMTDVPLKAACSGVGYQIVRSASKPGWIVPFVLPSPYSLAGFELVSSTNFWMDMRPVSTPPQNIVGSRVSSPGSPFGIWVKLDVPFFLPRG